MLLQGCQRLDPEDKQGLCPVRSNGVPAALAPSHGPCWHHLSWPFRFFFFFFGVSYTVLFFAPTWRPMCYPRGDISTGQNPSPQLPPYGLTTQKMVRGDCAR